MTHTHDVQPSAPSDASPSGLAAYLDAELDYVIANFSDISPRFRRTLRCIAVFALLALSVDRQNPAQTHPGMAHDKLCFIVGKEWPEVTSKQLVAFVVWFANALDRFDIFESVLNATFLDL